MLRVDPHRYQGSILLAVSGGVDSMVMADLFCHKIIASEGSLENVAIAHCNFHLRGEESDSDEVFVRDWAERQGVRFFCKHFDTAEFASQNDLSIEMAARELRYRWFDFLCSEEGYAGVCVAHNANDNAETLLLNLLRGTGLKGLCAMDEVSKNPYGDSLVFRPLLEYSRSQIEEYARERSLQWHSDSTNLENDARRNLLRNKVFPLLREINPSFVDTFGRNAGIFRQSQKILDDFTQSHPIQDQDGNIDIALLKSMPHWPFLLYNTISSLGFNAPVISDLTELLQSGRILGGKTFPGPDGKRIVTTSSHIIISSAVDSLPEPRIELISWPYEGLSQKSVRGTILMDADKVVTGTPVLRRWRDGDWLIPIGMKGKKKVSDLLTDLKYDLLRKENVLVVEGEGSHILAVVGERIDSCVRITPSTSRVWKITSL